MQTAITISILIFAAIYLVLKWMPNKLKEKIRLQLLATHPQLAKYFESTVKKCASSCSSSCNSCDAQTVNNRQIDVKPIHFIHRS